MVKQSSHKNLRYVSRKDFPEIKKELLKKQNYTCPVSGKRLENNKEAVIDHQHKLFKDQPLGEKGAGLIRGVLDFRVNSWEGKVFNAFRRYGLHKFDRSLPQMLRKLADYLEDHITNMVHPSEQPKPKKLGKKVFKSIAKAHSEVSPRTKPLQYPKSGKLTKKLEELAKKYNIKV